MVVLTATSEEKVINFPMEFSNKDQFEAFNGEANVITNNVSENLMNTRLVANGRSIIFGNTFPLVLNYSDVLIKNVVSRTISTKGRI